MYNASDDFKTAVYAPIRTAKARVTFDISDVSADSDINTLVTTNQAPISDKIQLIDKRRQAKYNLITCEKDRVKLDGSFCFADDALINNKEIGFASDILSGDDKSFSINPALTFLFNSTHSSVGITVTFDTLNNEYATDFNITLYDSNGAVINSTDIAGNTLTQYVLMGPFNNYKKVVITMKKWSLASRRCRICEVDFGAVRVYEDNKLTKMFLIEDMDLAVADMPDPQFSFTVDNVNKEFNILNPTGFYKYLQQRQLVTPEIAVQTSTGFEYVPLGTFLLKTWQSDEGSLTATFTASTELDTLSSFDYKNLTPKSNYNLYQLAVDIFTYCGIINTPITTKYQIDESLKNILTNGLVQKTSCRNVLQMICTAGCANVYVDHNGVIIIKATPESIPGSVDTVDMDNMHNEAKIELDTPTKDVTVSYYTDINTNVDVTVDNTGVDKGDSYSLSGNTLIDTEVQATKVANWILKQKNYRAHYTIDWRGNPAHELNDVVDIENSFGKNTKAFIIKNEIDYQGYLSANTEARGLTNVDNS